jgi:hypothetical protein
MKLLLLWAAVAILGTPMFARIGETESQLVKRFGQPLSAEPHTVSDHGLVFVVGTTFTFVLGDWMINCDVIDGTCARIAYSKIGGWAEENFQTILNANAQGGSWKELLSPNVKQVTRKWRRDDGVVAHWILGNLTLTSPRYERGMALAEEKAKAVEQLAHDGPTS